MIGRNDPCPCGSGKKHKKCCLSKNEITLENLVEYELQRVVHSLYEQPLSHSDTAEYEKYRRQWTAKLGDLWDEKSIESSVSDYFFFVARRDIWNRHLVKVLNNPLRNTVRSVIENWQSPSILFGKVKDEKDGFIEVEEILGNKTLFLNKEEAMPTDKGTIVFGIVLPDNRARKDGVFVMTSLMFFKDGNGKFENEVVKLAESSGIENSMEFYQEYMADIYRVMLREQTLSTEDLIENELTPLQQEAIEILDAKLTTIGLNKEATELLTNITVTYFLKEQPNFRKPNVIGAGVFLVAVELGLLGEYSMTNSEIAKLFDVSTSSMTKHRDAIHGFVLDMIDNMSDKEQRNPGDN